MAGTGFYRNNSMVVFFCVFSVTVFVDVYQVFFCYFACSGGAPLGQVSAPISVSMG